MEQSQLIELISTLNPSERELIIQFASLPSFNGGKMRAHVLPLLIICLSQKWADLDQKIDKQSVFATLFPNQKFVEGRLEKIMVEAHKVVRTTLIVNHYFRNDNEFHQGFDFAEITRTKGLNTRYQQLLARLQKLQDDVLYKNERYFRQQALLENAIHESECYHNQKKGDLNVPNVLHAVEGNYHLNRIAVLNRILLQQKFSKVEVPDDLKRQIEETFIPVKFLEESSVLSANYAIFNLLNKDTPEPSDIRSLFDLLKLHEEEFDQETLQEIYTYLRNICILVISSDFENVEIEYTLLELYKDNLFRGYLHYEGKLHPSRYWAVSSNAIRVKEFEWALEFIEKYKFELIGENETHDIYRLNFANYLFGKWKYSECLDFIPASSPFVDYLLAGKRLELKAYYELQSELLTYKLEAFKVFLSRTSPKLLSETQKQMHVEFANLLTQISTSIKGDPKRSELLTKRIQEKKQAAEWRWLLEKAKALKDG